MRRLQTRTYPVFTLLLLITSALLSHADVHISPSGNDQKNNGTETRPFATLEKAREVVMDSERLGPTSIWIHPGTYRRSTPFVLTADHSGSAEAPIRYRARESEKPILTGAFSIPPQSFAKVTDDTFQKRLSEPARNNVVSIELRNLGIPAFETPPDFFTGRGGLPALYASGNPMPLSRWPNGREDTTMGEVTEIAEDRNQRGSFSFKDNRHTTWDISRGAWLSGLWRTPWDRQQVRIASIENGEVKLAGWVPGGIGSKYHRPAKDGTIGSRQEPYCALNLLEEIDQPGEWCIDLPTQTLIWWPPKSTVDAGMKGVEIATLNQPLIQIKGANHITLRGLEFTRSLDKTINIQGGNHIHIEGCEISHTGTGIHLFEGMHHRILSNNIHHTDGVGIEYTLLETQDHPRGENSKKLISDGHQFINNHLHHVSQLTLTGAMVVGDSRRGNATGCIVRNNLLHDLPNIGIRYSGNDNLFEFNEIHNVGLHTGDVGAFYTTLRITSAGNQIRQNLIHHCQGVNAIYLDDGACGTEVTNNIVYFADVGGWISGGRENKITNNLFLHCEFAQHVDDRGIARGYGDPTTHWGQYMWDMQYPSVNFDSPPWSTRYPGLGKRLKEYPGWPVGNVLGNNILVGNDTALRKQSKPEHLEFMEFPKSTELEKIGFLDLETLDLRLEENAPIKQIPNYPKIEVEKIGLFLDEYRTEFPHDPNRLTTLKEGAYFKSSTDLEASN